MWLKLTTRSERRTLLAGFLGYGLDGFDFMIYTFVIPTLLAVWHMTNAQAGFIATGALLTSAAGGWGAGVLADRFGRVRILQLTVVWFAAFTFLSGFTHSYPQLLFARAMQGFGFGGEWAVGSVLIAETIEAQHRGKATGLVQSSWAVGWAAAAVAFWAVYALVPARARLEDLVLDRHRAGASHRLHSAPCRGIDALLGPAARAECGRRASLTLSTSFGGRCARPRHSPACCVAECSARTTR